jgi:hypothetical protein
MLHVPALLPALVPRRCHIGFRLRGSRGAAPPPTPPALRRAFSYHWRLWTVPECREMLHAAGFDATHVWVRHVRHERVCKCVR